MKLSESHYDTPEVLVAKAQAKADKYRQQSIHARAALFDTLYPDYKTNDITFKEQYIKSKLELERCTIQCDDLKAKTKKQSLEISRLRTLLFNTVKGDRHEATE